MPKLRSKLLDELLKEQNEQELVLTVLLFMSLNHDQKLGTFNLVRVIGYDNVLKLVAAYGGRTIRVPSFKELVAGSNLIGAAFQVLKGAKERDVLTAYKKEGIDISPHVLARVIAAVQRYRDHREDLKREVEEMGDEMDTLSTFMNPA